MSKDANGSQKRPHNCFQQKHAPFETDKSCEAPSGHELYVRGFTLKFPYPSMYNAQAQICDKLILAMERSKTERSLALLESPTGTGKTLALLTASLAWQEQLFTGPGLSPLAPFLWKNSEDPSSAPSTQPFSSSAPAKLSSEERASFISDALLDLSDYEEQEVEKAKIEPFKSIIATHSQKKKEEEGDVNNIGEGDMPTSTNRRKRGHIEIEKENEVPETPEAKKRSLDTQESTNSISSTIPTNTQSEKSTKEAQKKEEKAIPPPRVPIIFYATRTHSQVKKAISELYRMPYRPKMGALGARDNFCLNNEVRSLGKGEREVACRTQVRQSKCKHYKNRETLIKSSYIQTGAFQVWDIEELVHLGAYHDGCGYYASRELARSAHVVFCPYNYLIDLAIVAPFADIMRDSIVIIDEAHNIEDVCRTEASMQLSIGELDAMISAFKTFFELPLLYPRQFYWRTWAARDASNLSNDPTKPITNNPPATPDRPHFSLFSLSSPFHSSNANIPNIPNTHASTSNSNGPNSGRNDAPGAKKTAEELEFEEKLKFWASMGAPRSDVVDVDRFKHTSWHVLTSVESVEMPPHVPDLMFELLYLRKLVIALREWLHTEGRMEMRRQSISSTMNTPHAVWKEDRLLKVFAERFKITPFNVGGIIKRFERIQSLIGEIQEWEDALEKQKELDKGQLPNFRLHQDINNPSYRGYFPQDPRILEDETWHQFGYGRTRESDFVAKPNWHGLEPIHYLNLNRLFRILAFMLLNDCQYLSDYRMIVEKVKTNNPDPESGHFGSNSNNSNTNEEDEDTNQNYSGARITRKSPNGRTNLNRRNVGSQHSNPEYDIQFNFLCLNAACLFRELMVKARCVALVSGTLNPFSSLRAELGVEPIVSPSNIVQCSTQHIIAAGSPQLMCLRLNEFPSDLDFSKCPLPLSTVAQPSKDNRDLSAPLHQMRWNYLRTSDPNAANWLGNILLQLLPNVPGGALVFFSSYRHMNFVIRCWKDNGQKLWNAISRVKSIFAEPSAANGGEQVKQLFKDTHQSYLRAVDASTNDGTGGGAIFMAVARGKIAEGIDFADQYARAIFVVGIPYPNLRDPGIVQKREWNQEKFQFDLAHFSGTSPQKKQWMESASRNEQQQSLSTGSLLSWRSKESTKNLKNQNSLPLASSAPNQQSSRSRNNDIAAMNFNLISDWQAVDTLGETMFLNSQMWYEIQAYRAVNQTLGRCIRHARDYGAILFLDDRFEMNAVERHLSGWVRASLSPANSLITPIATRLKEFYIQNKHLNPVPSPQNAEKSNLIQNSAPISPFASSSLASDPSSMKKMKSWASASNIIAEPELKRSHLSEPPRPSNLIASSSQVNNEPINAFARLMPQRPARVESPPPLPPKEPAPVVQEVPEPVPIPDNDFEEDLENDLIPDLGEEELYEIDEEGFFVPILNSPFSMP